MLRFIIFTYIVDKKNNLKERTNSEYILKEFERGSFERQFRLAKNIGHEKVEARYENGILTIKFFDVPTEEEIKNKEVKVT